MRCCGEREKFGDLRVEQKWEYINLDDFKARSCWTGFAYGYLIFMLFVSLSVYAVDTFTAINLLAFDRWAGRIEPAIPLRISRWIFAGCIILSFVLLIYRWIRAIKVIRQGGVAKSYLDPLAVRLQSIRMGEKGRGWKRFLVFAELTKSKKGADYVALFSYFSFEAWLRIVFAEGPRQVINGITLYSVAKTDLLPDGDHSATDGRSKFDQFWVNVGVLADDDRLQAVVLFGMLWTLVIWLFAAICLALSVILYLIFLWHHIPSGDGGLSRYCRIKINRRMERIVKAKVDKALKKENELRVREEAKAARDGLEMKKQPTLPSLDSLDAAVASLPPLSRQTTMTTLPEYSSRPGSAGGMRSDSPPPVPALPYTHHHNTPQMNASPPDANPAASKMRGSDTSWLSYASNVPLMHQAADMARSPPSAGPANPYGRTQPPPPRPYPHGAARQGSAGSNTSGGGPADHQVRPSNPYFPTIQETDSGRSSPAPNVAGPSRTNSPFSARGPPSDRHLPPMGPARPDRSFSPVVPPPRSLTAGPERPSPFGPPPRSLTAGPDRSFSPVQPPARSQTAGPESGRFGPPPRSLTAGPESGRPGPFGPPPRSLTAGPESSGRSGSPFGPPRSFTPGQPSSGRASPFGPPPRSFTAGPPSPDRSGSPFRPPPRSRSAVPAAQPSLPALPPAADTYDHTLLDSYRTATPEPYSPAAAAAAAEWPLQPARRPASLQRQGTNGSEVDDILGHY